MRSRLTCLAAAGAVMVLSGCLPEAKVLWSRDGRWALVRGGDGLYLSDVEGRLSARLAEDVPAAAWLPDSRGFVAACGESVGTWEALRDRLDDADREAVEAQAAEFRRQVLAFKGDWDNFRFEARPGDVVAALVCLRDTYGGELAPVVGPKWAALKDLRRTVYHVQEFTVTEGQAAPVPQRLFVWPGPIAEIRVAPDGKALALAAPAYPPRSPEPAFSLYAVSLTDPRKPAHVADRVSLFFDWTHDGQSLVYAAADQSDGGAAMPSVGLASTERSLTYTRNRVRDRERQPALRGGGLLRRPVVGEGGALDGTSATRLADVLFFDSLPVRCLRDGRVLFAALDARLPAVPGDRPKRLSLFALDPADGAAVKRVLAPEVEERIGDRLDLLQLSPDETRLAVPDGYAVKVVDLATGRVTQTCGEEQSGRCPTIPVWRTGEELCFVVPRGSPHGSPDRQEVVLWSRTGSRCLSRDWPDAVARGFLEERAAQGEKAPAAITPRDHAALSMIGLHTLGQAAIAHAADSAGRLPQAQDYPQALEKYFGQGPGEARPVVPPGRRFVMNAALGGRRLADLADRDRTVLFFEGNADAPPSGSRDLLRAVEGDPEAVAIGFADGSVRLVPREQAAALLWQPREHGGPAGSDPGRP